MMTTEKIKEKHIEIKERKKKSINKNINENNCNEKGEKKNTSERLM